jgi:hypothetical protein
METAMRFLAAAAIVGAVMVALSGSAYAQVPMGIPIGEPKKDKPVDQAKENEYNKTLRDLPNQKAADPWGNVRTEQAAAGAKKPAEKKATGPAPKTASSGKGGTAGKDASGKNATAPKNAAADKKAN